MAVELDDIFNNAVTNTLFKNKSALQVKYTPENIKHRDEEIKNIAGILASALRGERPSNLFIYGETGTGKTLSVEYVCKQLSKKAKEMDVNVKFEYINCKLRKVADTEYRILAALIQKMGGDIPATGLPTDKVWSKFIELIDKEKQLVVFVFDEIDQAVKKMSDEFLYTLTRLNQELIQSQISIIGISNDVRFLENIDSRVKSSLGEEELVFHSYNAIQLVDILNERCSLAFKEGVISSGVVEKCSAYAAREHGDARRALDLIRIAGELCERDNKSKLEEEYIEKANEKLEKDKIIDVVENCPKQQKLVLYSIIKLSKDKKNGKIDKYFTGDVYGVYQDLCNKIKPMMDILTQRRISDILAELDMMGIINAKVISKGRQGRTRDIRFSIPDNIAIKVENILHDSLGI